MKKLATLKREMLKNPEVRKAYEAVKPEYEIARELIRARTRAGLSQSEIAQRMGTTQSAVARMESGTHVVSISTLIRFAEATDSRTVVRLVSR